MIELADYHNKVSVNFAGSYPGKPFKDTLQCFCEDVRNGKSRIAVVESEGKIVGFCKADISEGKGKIDYLFVRKGCRGDGYVDLLVNWAVKLFQLSGVLEVEVKVVDGNSAVEFYEKYGFKMNAHILKTDWQNGIGNMQ